MKLAVRAPNHLGDGVMALPAIQALARLGPTTVYAPGWAADLYRDLDVMIRPRGTLEAADVAVLFAPSLRAAWEARRCARVIGTDTDFRRMLLTHPVRRMPSRPNTYRALATVAGASVSGVPRFEVRDSDGVRTQAEGHVGLNPVSVGGAVREWQGFRALAGRLQAPAVFYGGPGEQDAVNVHAGDHPTAVGLSLPAFAASLQSCSVFVSSDSGAAHFAAACGIPTVVVFGSTTASRTGAPGVCAVEGPPMVCRPCYGRRCTQSLECLAIPVGRVQRAVEEVLRG